VKTLIVMEPRPDAGSIQAVGNYVQSAEQTCHEIAVYGQADARFPRLRFSADVAAFDQVLFIYESNLYWMSEVGLPLEKILSEMPRARRAILDADGMYNSLISVSNYDRNHPNARSRLEWIAYFDWLAAQLFQPTFAPTEPGAQPLLFYGYEPAAQVPLDMSRPKRYDIMYVGHNWWRWLEMSRELLPAIERIRGNVGAISLVGLWWEESPNINAAVDGRDPFWVDREQFRRLGIQVRAAVHHTKVIATMGESRVNIMMQRPLLRHLKHLTSKYFEIFCANTIPLVMLDPDHAELVYGRAGRELALHDNMAEKLLDALTQPRRYGEIVEEVRHHLRSHHSYEIRLHELTTALGRSTIVPSQGTIRSEDHGLESARFGDSAGYGESGRLNARTGR
jgi:hypothetical protein